MHIAPGKVFHMRASPPPLLLVCTAGLKLVRYRGGESRERELCADYISLIEPHARTIPEGRDP